MGAGALVTGTLSRGWVANATEKPSSVASNSTHQRLRRMRRYSIGPIYRSPPDIPLPPPRFRHAAWSSGYSRKASKASPFWARWKSPVFEGSRGGRSIDPPAVPLVSDGIVSRCVAQFRGVEYVAGLRSRVRSGKPSRTGGGRDGR